jgi:hypothetical protein
LVTRSVREAKKLSWRFQGSTLDPDTVAHEYSSFFFSDNGRSAANASGFGWRNGG